MYLAASDEEAEIVANDCEASETDLFKPPKDSAEEFNDLTKSCVAPVALEISDKLFAVSVNDFKLFVK